jgi:hypothetical protein
MFGETEAKAIGDMFERGLGGNLTANNPMEASFMGLVNNELGRQNYSEFMSQNEGADLANLETFTSYLNFMADKAVQASDDTKDVKVRFNSSDRVVQRFHKHYVKHKKRN